MAEQLFAGEIENLRLDIKDLIEIRQEYMSAEAILLVLKQQMVHWECIVATDLTMQYGTMIQERNAKLEA
jgi:uncharacterized protein